PETKPCWCGKSTITYVTEMDDWNRTRNSRIINCPDCFKKNAKEVEEEAQKKLIRENLFNEAKELAIDNYLNFWLEKFEGMNKKQIWEYLTNGDGYPSLGTFYKHTKDE